MKASVVVFLVALCASAGSVVAEDISVILRRLDSDRLAERDAAETELIRQGPSIEAVLPAEEMLDGNPEFSEEVVYRLKNVFQELRLRTVRESLDKITFCLAKVETGSDGRSWITLRADWPKGVFPIRLAFPMNTIQGIDGENRRFSPVIQNGILEIPLGKTRLSGEFVVGLRGEGRIQSVRGNCAVLLAIGEKTFVFRRFVADSPAAKPERTIRMGQTTVAIESVRFDSSRLAIRFGVHFDQAFAALESHRIWIYENEVSLQLRSGDKIKPLSVNPISHGGNSTAFTATFELPKDDDVVAFLYTTPTLIVEESITFEALGVGP